MHTKTVHVNEIFLVSETNSGKFRLCKHIILKSSLSCTHLDGSKGISKCQALLGLSVQSL